MASSSRGTNRLKKLAKQIQDPKVTQAIIQGLSETDHRAADRTIAIIAATLIERALQAAILSRFVPLSNDDHERLFSADYNGPLAYFAQRIRVGYALGLFGPRTRSDLDKIRNVRNAFAHTETLIGFDTDEIAEQCNGLHTIMHFATLLRSDTPKGKYVDCSIYIAEQLRGTIETRGLGGLALFPFSTYKKLP